MFYERTFLISQSYFSTAFTKQLLAPPTESLLSASLGDHVVIFDSLQKQSGATLNWVFSFDKSLCPSEFVVRVSNLSIDLACVLKGIDCSL